MQCSAAFPFEFVFPIRLSDAHTNKLQKARTLRLKDKAAGIKFKKKKQDDLSLSVLCSPSLTIYFYLIYTLSSFPFL